MTSPDPGAGPRLLFLFDEHVHAAAATELQARGVGAVHVGDVGLLGADDALVFGWAREHDRIIVTRNYHDFAPLVEGAARQALSFPGVLFCSPSLSPSDAGAHVAAIERFLAQARERGSNPVAGTLGWLD